ncbi:MAG: hypothetical protein H7327_10140 [Herminiimonas sp.]|nr:hypothetical protein [Herminiimonas sp.]
MRLPTTPTLLHTLLTLTLTGAALIAPAVQAKLPAPSPEEKAKKDEAAAKTAANDKIAAYKLCQVQDRVAGVYLKTMATAGKPLQPAADLPACTDPGPYVAAAPATKVGVADSLPLNKEPIKK